MFYIYYRFSYLKNHLSKGGAKHQIKHVGFWDVDTLRFGRYALVATLWLHLSKGGFSKGGFSKG